MTFILFYSEKDPYCEFSNCYFAEASGKNPYSLKKYTLEEALGLYEKHVRSKPELMAALPELGEKVLGCWCKPEGCHGDVLVKLYKEIVLGKAPQ